MNIVYSNHAVKQMFVRGISTMDVEYVIQYGETIMDYANDKPYPSKLLLSFGNGKPIHVVCSYNIAENTTIVITTYVPTLDIWENDFKTRKK